MSARLALSVATILSSTLAAVSPAQPTVEELLKIVRATDPQHRETLFELLQPVVLSNCELQRFGEPNDGGYLMCGNLLGEVEAGYSYGIANYDQMGVRHRDTLARAASSIRLLRHAPAGVPRRQDGVSRRVCGRNAQDRGGSPLRHDAEPVRQER